MTRFLSRGAIACLLAVSTVSAQTAAQTAAQPTQPPSRDGGWESLARVLDTMKPRVDTRLAPTPSDITDQIEALLNRGQTRQALAFIQERLAAETTRRADRRPGVDVQLAFLHARALAASGDLDGASRQYETLTRQYPELPEPWNNLAALYAQQGQLERARQALHTALAITPQYGAALANLADVHLMMAAAAYASAADAGVPEARQRAQAIRDLLEQP